MKRLFISTCVVCLCIVTGCQNDSDYTIANYDALTTVKLSSCPEKIFTFPDNVVLPTGLLPGQTRRSHWEIRRTGITGNGAHKIIIFIKDSQDSTHTLTLSGVMDDNLIRVEMQQNVIQEHCEVYRFILLYGIIDKDTLTGEIRSILSTTRTSGQCPTFIPPTSPCEVLEGLTGTVSSEQ